MLTRLYTLIIALCSLITSHQSLVTNYTMSSILKPYSSLSQALSNQCSRHFQDFWKIFQLFSQTRKITENYTKTTPFLHQNSIFSLYVMKQWYWYNCTINRWFGFDKIALYQLSRCQGSPDCLLHCQEIPYDGGIIWFHLEGGFVSGEC